MNALLALVAVLGVSASGPLMAATQAPALAIAFWRNAAASVVLVPVAAVRRRDELRALSPRGRRLVVVAGTMLALHFAFWVGSLKLTSVAAATALVTTQLVWVIAIDRIRGLAVPTAALVGSALAVAGVLVVSGFDFQVSGRALLGDAMAVAGGLFAALYLVAGNEVRRELSTTAYTAACYTVCSAVLAAAALVSGVELAGFDTRDWLLIVAVTISAQFLGHSLLNHLLAVMTPMVISLLLLFEVPLAALLAAVFLSQSPPWGVYLGLGLILAGLAVVTTRRPVPEPPLVD
ncbi:putative membrane protein [Aeromicrobium marinum DSM 15272]|uniref:Membrane protein n=1 Tax=Aeromicrobium marinum DSM 15272 TaxID=585531 RepID=E2SDQ0_9ACTN|nr:DMT family transporter [Aeromicrobium marinum]EFQ82627.1 putative membrane protein [Aeromicrobium marinum DSM 15272]